MSEHRHRRSGRRSERPKERTEWTAEVMAVFAVVDYTQNSRDGTERLGRRETRRNEQSYIIEDEK